MEQIPHSHNHSYSLEQANDYNFESILEKTHHLEIMIYVLTQTTTFPLLEANNTQHESSSPNIVIVNLFNEHGLEEEHAHDKTSFIETMIDNAYKCDYEIFDYMTYAFTNQCSKLMTENQSNNEYHNFEDTQTVKYSLCKLDVGDDGVFLKHYALD